MKNKNTTNAMVLLCAWAGMAGAANAQTDCKTAAQGITVEATCGEADGSIDITVTGGQEPFSFLWSTGATTEDLNGLASGSYWVQIEDQTKCIIKYDFDLGCEEPKVCQYRTQTQGGWGAPPNGGNPGAYVHANFASVFPTGLTIGCGRTLRLTNAQAVTNFLPSGSTPKILLNNAYLNPTTYNNVLAGQLVAATLSVAFDAANPDFGAGSGNLGDLLITSGTFTGWSVNDLLAEANRFIGNCGSTYTASQLNNALTLVNESYVDGTTNTGFLSCDEKKDGKRSQDGRASAVDGMLLFPNPARDAMAVTIRPSMKGAAHLVMLDQMGRQVMDLGTTAVEAGVSQTVRLSVDQFADGIYFLRMDLAGARSTQRFVLAR